MNHNQPCSFCGKKNNNVSERKVRKRFNLSETAKAPVVCCQCYPHFVTKKKPKDFEILHKGQSSDSYPSIENLLESKNFNLIGDILLSIKEKERILEKETEYYLWKIESIQKRKSRLTKKIDRIRSISDVFPEISYYFRRAEANRFISKPWVRVFVFKRDNFSCQSCGSERNLTIDHVVPVKAGGKDDMENLQTLCKKCNSSKGSKTEAEVKK